MFSLMSLFPFVYIFFILIPMGPLIYIFVRWLSGRKSKPVDPNLGIKVITYYFKTFGYHISLIGFFLIIHDIFKGGSKNSFMTGVGVLICGGVVYLIHFLIVLKFFNDTEFTITKKVYNTFNLILAGLVGITSMIIFLLIILSKKPLRFEIPLAFFIVYFIAWIFQSWYFYKPLFSKAK
ncbi:MAG: hypothetical protein ABFR36_03510 [Acidobacteriota bacterium]